MSPSSNNNDLEDLHGDTCIRRNSISSTEKMGYDFLKGYRNAETIIESLHRTNGIIDETIKKGYATAILNYAMKGNIEGVKIDFEADFPGRSPGCLSVHQAERSTDHGYSMDVDIQ